MSNSTEHNSTDMQSQETPTREHALPIGGVDLTDPITEQIHPTAVGKKIREYLHKNLTLNFKKLMVDQTKWLLKKLGKIIKLEMIQ
jgi:hypothetical protein